ncbi:MAG TPA: mannose-1-phosphate guanylyltransferase [Bacteroidota bacterium]|nr:mannose-1-phosphate guanylyltransferase [Bacteroidota bacterium]
MPKTCAVIMAGGVGTRFWPRSREKFPKHLLQLFGKGTMIQNTVKRLEPLVPPQDVLVVTNRLQKSQVVKQLPQLPEENIIVEPVGRNTAPCIGLAALHVHRMDPEAIMIVLPADHLIGDEKEFQRVLTLASETARESASLITIGITPSFPETGYGYIQFVGEEGPQNPYHERGVLRVKTFAEKPNQQTAERFLASGDFLWNSGMFVWRVDTILKQIEKCLPDTYGQLQKIDAAIGTSHYQQTLETAYGMIRGISIDYGVMEKAEAAYVIPGSFGWNDIGSWDEVYRVSGKDDSGNSVTGKVIQKDTKNTYIYSPDKVVATVGVEDLIIVNTEDALLICRRGRSQDVKEVSDYLKRKQMNEYL